MNQSTHAHGDKIPWQKKDIKITSTAREFNT